MKEKKGKLIHLPVRRLRVVDLPEELPTFAEVAEREKIKKGEEGAIPLFPDDGDDGQAAENEETDPAPPAA